MMKKIALSGLLLSALSLPLLAQQTPAPTTPTTTQRGNRRMMQPMGDPATRAQKMTARMTQQLGLDQATSKKVYDIALARAQQVDAIQKGTDDGRTKAKALKANADDFKSKLQTVMTPDQFAKFESMRGQMHGQMRRGHRGADSDANSDVNGAK